ncbi:hypothetical protein ACGF8B_19615 [Streptomyces sp. NPDC047917]|uniref:hypothetical protein n=1 Tax=Streptomyces sp. NPDC047917 TaxID=3365491 RepID=UPI0037182577
MPRVAHRREREIHAGREREIHARQEREIHARQERDIHAGWSGRSTPHRAVHPRRI